ncbi:cytolethal distending toxin subunit Aa-CdtA [Aggregatibacter actinomycetemcomitans]|uniref:cytolethal distending toxin subunit Aa-CdtA n=1 Tax=Aggregatibacter actinomycetemcomitans TaxID=714 RepID=UPI0002400411|nr:cytolethal distending toxin subunit Aa-CdtA [Aggregatibacter actinomycetemcomitans]EHK90267.1 cytolethal distending toxin protein A [Aggregatibacter actinomycetemcomitans RhAA1]KNE77333.1 cytochrome C oxidase subunit I [Aggregatibacter actinomycetemcomitans RhAA1]
MKKFLPGLLLMGLVACSSNQRMSDYSQPESQSDLALKSSTEQFQPQPLLSKAPSMLLNLLSSSGNGQVSPSEPSNFMTLMGQNGALLTVWALAKRNWLWAYPNIYSQDFGNIRNWKIELGKHREYFRFVNQSLGTCIEAYGNGLIHDTCSPDKLAQEFELLPTNSGAVVIKSVSQGRCVTYNPVSPAYYSTVTLSACDGATEPLRDQTWYLAPPVLEATAVN